MCGAIPQYPQVFTALCSSKKDKNRTLYLYSTKTDTLSKCTVRQLSTLIIIIIIIIVIIIIIILRDYRGSIKPKCVPFKKYLATLISSHRNCTDSFETPCIYNERSRNIYAIRVPPSAPRRCLPTAAHTFLTNHISNTRKLRVYLKSAYVRVASVGGGGRKTNWHVKCIKYKNDTTFQTQLNCIYYIELHVSTYLRSPSGLQLLFKTYWERNVHYVSP